MATDDTTTAGGAEDIQNQSEFNELLFKSSAESEKLNMLLSERADLLNESAEALKSQTETLNAILNNAINLVPEMESIQSAITAQTREYERQKAIAKEQLDLGKITRDQYHDLNAANAAAAKEAVKAHDEQLDKHRQSLKVLMDQFKAGGKLEKLSEARNAAGVKYVDLINQAIEAGDAKGVRDNFKELTAINKDFLALQRKTKDVTKKVAASLGLSAKFSDTTLGTAINLKTRFDQMKGALGPGGISDMMSKIRKQTFNFRNLFGAVVEFSAKAALEISNLSRNLGAATGFGDKFNNEIARLAQQGNMAGIGFKESAEALKSLTENVSSFNPEAEETNEHMGLTVARLQKLGVSAASSGKAMDFLQRTMNLTGEAAANMTAQLARMGKEIGITGTKMIQQFNAVAGRMAIFGRDNIKVFKELAAVAKATGMEIGTLTKIAQGFDTFDKAADSAARLNSVLGTQLSTLEMLAASDSERIMMLRQEVKMSVGNFDALDKHTAQYIAQAMGVSDVAEAQRLLNMSTAEYQKYISGQQKQADIQQEIADATEELVPMMQQLKLAGIQLFMAFKPVITVFSVAVRLVSKLISLFGDFAKFIGFTGSEMNMFTEFVVGGFTLMGLAALAFGAKLAFATGGLTLLVGGLAAAFGAFHMKGSPELWELPAASAEGYETMANSMAVANEAALATSASMKGVHDSMHKAGGKSFSIESMAKLDTSKIAAGITKVKSALMELSTLKIDGFLAMSTDGTSTSMIMGSESLVKNISEGKLTVDVKMPEFQMPEINVKVFIGDTELRTLIRKEASAVYVGRTA